VIEENIDRSFTSSLAWKTEPEKRLSVYLTVFLPLGSSTAGFLIGVFSIPQFQPSVYYPRFKPLNYENRNKFFLFFS
jgi:hypothetical protein